MKKFKKLTAIIFSLVMILSLTLLTGCGEQSSSEIIKTLGSMQIDSAKAWQITATIESEDNNYYDVFGYAKGTYKSVVTINGLTTLNKDNPFENLKADFDLTNRESEIFGDKTTTDEETQVLHARTNGDFIDLYLSENGGQFDKNSYAISEIWGEVLAPSTDAKQLSTLFDDKGVINNAVITYGASSKNVGGNLEVTIDFITYAKTLLEKVETIFNNVEVTDTMNDIYQKQEVKDLINLHFGSATAKEIVEEIVAYATAQGVELPEGIEIPAEGVSVYDYIQTIFNTEINGVTIGNLPVGSEITAMKSQFQIAFDEMRTQLDNTTFQIKVLVKNNSFKGASVVFKQETNTLTVQEKVNVNVEIKESNVGFVDVTTLNAVEILVK